MGLIPVPTTIETQDKKNNTAEITIEPCYPGYGTTLGNALRRVLLSSMPGAAIVKAQVKGVTHEFTTLPGVKEDIVELILNLKQVRLKLHSDEPVQVQFQAKGEGKATAKSIKATSDVEIASPDQVIATLTEKDAVLDMTLTVENGKGFIPVEMQDNADQELGTIAIDALYSPIKNVNFDVEHVRVGEITNFDKLVMTITTDGTTTPQDAFTTAAQILVDHFEVFAPKEEKKTEKKAVKKTAKEK